MSVVLVLGLVVLAVAFAAQFNALRRPRSTSSRPRVPRQGWRRAGRSLLRSGRFLYRAVPAVVGGLVLLVLLDWGVGAAWDRLVGSTSDEPRAALATSDLPPAEDPRVDHPAMADAPWADRYFAEMEALEFTYVPFVGPREAPVAGRYVASADGVRRSYEPADGDDELPEVWFFGGSALWGEGQRDDHTIPSEVARLAEAAGTPVRVLNFGIRGYSALQELLVFEQELARRGQPDLAVFYHGFNELSTQVEAPENLSEQPTIFQLTTTTDAFDRAPALPGEVAPGEPTVGQEYVQTSALHKLLRNLGQVARVPAAGAEEPFYVPPPAEMAEAIDHAEVIYRRTMRMLEHVASEHDVPLAVYWQPADQWFEYDELTDRVAGVGGAIDLSQALADLPAPVYLDGVHTNELGARVVAEAMWPTLADRLTDGSES
ncbi:MAG: SGNH/GDSL hydrolase family protein [Acidimicrobiales bacterium]|nr:SGNH/GDSL hydrolase family protein [Acidimicrobiales bacterium]